MFAKLVILKNIFGLVNNFSLLKIHINSSVTLHHYSPSLADGKIQQRDLGSIITRLGLWMYKLG